jgi:hypothetical protein
MLIVGQQTVFLSHLGRFRPPHHYQAILQASFAKPGTRRPTTSMTASARTKIYTLEPELFVLPMLVVAEPPKAYRSMLHDQQRQPR